MSNNQEKISEAVNKLFKELSDNYIFIYTPPKVGSTTLVSSLRVSLGRTYNIIHIHDEIMLSVLTGIKDITILQIIHYLSFLNKNIYVIDVYRTPVERKISEFFEKISTNHFNNTEEKINNYNISRVIERFNKIFPHIENGDHYFDKYNIQNPVLFDFNKKYSIQEINNIKYIKIRLCDSHLWGNILSTIFQTDIVLIEDYTTNKKIIGELYKKFKLEYKLPANFFEDIKNNTYLQFYYSNEERNKYLNDWSQRITSPFIPYTTNEYLFYIQLCLENQYLPDIQIDHYIDNGCFCKYCSLKRKEIFFKAKKGETQFDKIIHHEVVLKDKQQKINNIHEKINKIFKNYQKQQLKNSKFVIQLYPK
jgi:5-methylcytosine-specific restriction endonuclease McrA